ncbi:TAXI family TRAP transporter solute-binding subunit [Catenuloplanes sp. NPDC051500]|uniref:TAXI family TRAP transporter solute-binding subunit n=1 Tax=Catenuloplanes sp. NPDC051500 TaxID=3363959 RepID=UPI0037B5D015
MNNRDEPANAVPRRAVLAGLAVLAGAAACSGGPVGPRRLRIASSAGDLGAGLADLVNRHLRDVEASVVTPMASAGTVDLIARGEAEIGLSQTDLLGVDASVTALARVYDDLLHLVVPADHPITTVDDLRGRRVSVGETGSGTAVTAGRLLAAAGLTAGAYVRSERSLDNATAALTRGDLDAFFFSGGLPVARIRELSARTRIRIVDLSGWAGALRSTYSDVYVVRNVPTSTYQAPPSATIADATLLLASASLPDALAYDVTRLLLERRDVLAVAHPALEALDVRSAAATMPAPLHPGAARYYRSVKP